ncbi:Ras-associating domain-containing protein, partial [Meloidogyne graminicola]
KFQVNSSSLTLSNNNNNNSKQTTLISSNSPSLSSIPSACSSSSNFSNSSNFKRNSRHFSSFSFEEEENKQQLLLPCKKLLCSCCNNSLLAKHSTLEFSKNSSTSSINNEGKHHLRIYTNQVRPDTDYKTLYITQNTNTNEIIRLLVWDKLRLQLRDLNLFHLLMEINTSTRNSVGLIKICRNIIKLDNDSNPLELQKCHPEGMSRFILGMDNDAVLVRIYDGELCPQSNYKSIFISKQTTCSETLILLNQICFRRNNIKEENLLLFIKNLKNLNNLKLIPNNSFLADIYLNLLPEEILQVKRADSLENEENEANNDEKIKITIF